MSCDHIWYEQLRYLPLDDSFESASHLIFPEVVPDGPSAEEKHAAWVGPPAHIVFACNVPGCIETKVIDVPEEAHARLCRMFENGEMNVNDVSQLPLGELIPEMKEDQPTILSGAARLGGVG